MRDMLSKEAVRCPASDSQQYSWEDLLEMRMFQSYIYKQGYVHDCIILEYVTGIDAQLESDWIKDQLM